MLWSDKVPTAAQFRLGLSIPRAQEPYDELSLPLASKLGNTAALTEICLRVVM